MTNAALEMTLDSGANPGWVIRQPIEKLQAKYHHDALSLHFDAYFARRAREDPAWGNRLEAADVAMTWLMHSNFTEGEILSLVEPAKRASIEAALVQVPQAWPLAEQPLTKECIESLLALFRAFGGPGIRVSKMMKVLCQKRTWIPMVDGYVMGFLFPAEWPPGAANDGTADAEAAVSALSAFAALLAKNRVVIDAVALNINSWLKTATDPVFLTPTRVLDSLLWFDRGGYRHFPGWSAGARHVTRAVP